MSTLTIPRIFSILLLTFCLPAFAGERTIAITADDVEEECVNHTFSFAMQVLNAYTQGKQKQDILQNIRRVTKKNNYISSGLEAIVEAVYDEKTTQEQFEKVLNDEVKICVDHFTKKEI